MQELTGKPNVREAVRLLGEWTRGRFDIWMLAGSHNAGNRAILLSHLLGLRQPQSKAGVNALRDSFYSALEVTGSCLAAKEDYFVETCRLVMASMETPIA
jgi:hypothetical protein